VTIVQFTDRFETELNVSEAQLSQQSFNTIKCSSCRVLLAVYYIQLIYFLMLHDNWRRISQQSQQRSRTVCLLIQTFHYFHVLLGRLTGWILFSSEVLAFNVVF